MDAKKTVDFVSGRLAKKPTRQDAHGYRRKKRSSYGASRLGLTPDKGRDDPEPVEEPSVAAAPPARIEPPCPEPADMAPVPMAPARIEPADMAPARIEPAGIEPPAATSPAEPKRLKIDPAALNFLRKKPPVRRHDPKPVSTTVTGVSGRLRTLRADDVRTWGRDLWTGMTSLLGRRKKTDQDEADAESTPTDSAEE